MIIQLAHCDALSCLLVVPYVNCKLPVLRVPLFFSTAPAGAPGWRKVSRPQVRLGGIIIEEYDVMSGIDHICRYPPISVPCGKGISWNAYF
ncbi:hypothetical protein F5X96DRAFT_654294 [Biscogniauxia mediterranea]|nr:hypothetical protein F5X96DRAFT_654294 [Biscogniauxia mediterranea]